MDWNWDTPPKRGQAGSPASQNLAQEERNILSTPELQKWMSNIEVHLSDVCTIASEGKLNSDQKMKIANLCRKIGYNTSHLAIMYQSMKRKAFEALDTIEILRENCDVTAHISELKKTVQENCSTRDVSFAEMVKKGTNSYIRPSKCSAVAIYPSDKLRSSDETKTLVQKLIRPEAMKLQVRGVRKTKNGGVIISTETKEDADKLKKAVQHSTSSLTADEPLKRKPRIVVVGVPSNMKEDEVYRCIFEQNVTEKIPSMTLDVFMTSIKLSHKSGRKDAPYCNYVIEVSANVRKALISQSRVFIHWTSCPVRDFTLVTRCYKCHQYGHAAKSCRDTTSTCGHCGDAGHSMSECPKKSDPAKCATCLKFKKPSNHKTADAECPAKKFAEIKYINSIDYGDVIA